jgi:hypothetical protein
VGSNNDVGLLLDWTKHGLGYADWVWSYVWWVLSADSLANAASILTAIIAVLLWIKLTAGNRRRRKRLEEFLKLERDRVQPRYKGLRSAHLIMRSLPMTEDQILSAAFASNVVRIWSPTPGGDGLLQFQYEPQAKQVRKKDLTNRAHWAEPENT